MKKYIIPDWIKQYENDAAPFSIEKIVLKKYEDDWTLFFYSNDDTTGGIVDLCQYFGHKKLNFSPSITYAERIIS